MNRFLVPQHWPSVGGMTQKIYEVAHATREMHCSVACYSVIDAESWVWFLFLLEGFKDHFSIDKYDPGVTQQA